MVNYVSRHLEHMIDCHSGRFSTQSNYYTCQMYNKGLKALCNQTLMYKDHKFDYEVNSEGTNNRP